MLHAFVRILLLTVALWGGAPEQATAQDRATVFAAASLSGVLEQIFPASQTVISYAGSGVLARQVAAGAPVDLVVLANTDWMNWLVETGTAERTHVQAVATNRLVVIGAQAAGPLQDAEDLIAQTPDDRIAMGQRQAVPAGQYAREWLEATAAWHTLSPRMIETQNVRAALDLVARGETRYGIVYASDLFAASTAGRAPDITLAYAVPPRYHSAIVYPAAALTPAGATLLAQMAAPQAQAILSQNGFGPAP